MGFWREEGQRERSRERSTDLPEDLITEILQHLPVRSLLRFKCVCKLWYSLIICPNFIALHRMNSQNHKIGRSIFCYLFSRSPATTTSTISFRFNCFPVDLTVPIHKPGDFGVVGCSGGVVCLSLRCGDEYVMWNPATRQSRKINGHGINNISNKEAWFQPGFCFDPLSNAFKLIQLELLVVGHVSIFTTCDNTWREKTLVVPSHLLFGGYGGERAIGFVACVKRFMYWNVHARGHYVRSEAMHILCLDMIDEMFKRIELPPHGATDFSSLRFVNYKDSFAMFAHNMEGSEAQCSSFDVWVLNDHDQSWSKNLTCKPSVSFHRALRVLSKDNTDLIVLDGNSTNYTRAMVLYDPESKRTLECPFEESGYKSFWYCESFASLD